MERGVTGKQKVIAISCIAAGVCLAGIVAAVILTVRRNPLTKGFMELAEELTALEAEMGEHFWTDAVNQVGSGNAQAEYSFNIGGISELGNITAGIDGKIARDMERKLCDTSVDISVANAKIAEASLLGTADTIYLQVPSIWEGSVVFHAEDVSGQWNNSALKKGLQLLTEQELEIANRIDADLFQSFSVDSFSVADFLEENKDALRDLYENMEVVEVEKAKKEGMLEEEQAELLKGVALENADGEAIETTCYLVILPQEELGAMLNGVQGDIRLCVYLDSGKRIVRIDMLPGENPVGDVKVTNFAVNLTGTESVTNRVELEAAGELDGRAVEETIILEKEIDKAGAYRVAWNGSLSDGGNMWDFSLEGSILGECVSEEEQFSAGAQDDKEGQSGMEAQDSAEEQPGTAVRLSIEIDNFVMKSGSEVISRGSGSVVFAPLTEEIQMPEGEEYRIAEMGEFETALFLMDCTRNVNENYSGYLKLLQ